MDAQKFLAEFGHIAAAPEGIERLREMIYNLAITGHLTEQFLEDGDAQTLLTAVESTRQQLIATKEFKRTAKLESLPLLSPSNIPLPHSWRWTRLLDIGEISPRNDVADEEIAAFIPMSGVSQVHNGELISEARLWGEIKKGFTHFANGDVVIAKITPCFENGKAAIIAGLDNPNGVGAGTTELHVFRPIHSGILASYIYIFLRSPFFVFEGERNMTGTAGQKRLPTEYFAGRAFPLPPTKEQARIVAKVDKLMHLCDKLAAQQQALIKATYQSRLAVFENFATATTVADFSQAWARVESSLAYWANDPAAAHDLRNAINSIAFRGLLTAEFPPDLAEMVPEFMASLPNDWKWETLGSLAEYITSGSRGWKEYISASGDTFIRSQDIKQDALVFENRAFVTLPDKAEGKRTRVQTGDILLTITGGNVGKCAQVPQLDCNAYVSQHVALLRLNNPAQSDFIHYWMTSTYGGRRFLARFIYGDKPGLNLKQVASVPVPLPPPEIQLKIVLELRRYKTICDKLAERSAAASEIAAKLAAASIATFTGIRTAEKEKTLKAPKTELISKLHLAQPPAIKEHAPLAAILARHQGELGAGDLWQRFGGEIDAFYAQLKLEVGKGWIKEPTPAEMRELEAN
jgi:type I restriction enzyme, S subunit